MINLGALKADPIDIGSQGNAVLGIRDSGKTFTATYLAEQLYAAGIPFIAFDPIGVWRFLRIPGKGKGIPVVVAGGQDGDLPLNPKTVSILIEAAMKGGVSLILDLFDINLSKADWRRIVMEALRTLLHKNQQYGLRHVFIEEAAEFAPQKVMDGHVYAEMEKLARMGGNARLGYTLINQRAEEVNKALLELCDNLFLHRQKGRNSLTALSKWLDIGNVVDHKDIIGTLATLPTGECWAWLGGTERPIRTKIPAKNSLHPDRRVKRGEDVLTMGSAVNVAAFVSTMREAMGTVEQEAKDNDPAELKAEISHLRQQLKNVVTQEDMEAAMSSATTAGIEIGFNRALGMAKAALNGITTDAPAGHIITPLVAFTESKTETAPFPHATPARLVKAMKPKDTPTGTLPRPQQRILDALAWWKALGVSQPSREQVAFVAGYTPTSGNYGNLLSQLRGGNYIEYPIDGRIELTLGGDAMSSAPEIAVTTESFHQAVRAKLSGPQTRVLDPILTAYPGSITNERLADEATYSVTSGNYGNLKSQLRTLGLIDYPSSGLIRASDWLFP